MAQLAKYAEEHKQEEEERLFTEYLENDKIKLAVTDDKSIGFRVPDTDTITVSRFPSNYNYNLYEDIDFDTLNGLEKDVIGIIEKQETILFWFRNRVANGWYAIQGWRENKIRPDFVVAKKKDDDKVEIAKVNVDTFPELAQQFSVRSIPALFLISDGKIVDRKIGVQSENDLKQLINSKSEVVVTD